MASRGRLGCRAERPPHSALLAGGTPLPPRVGGWWKSTPPPRPLCESTAERKGAGPQVLGRRRVGCQPANGLTSSAGIELMRSCDRAAGRLTAPPCAYTWRWEHVCHPVSIEPARVCDTMRIHLGRRALSAGERACWQASGAQDASRFLGPGPRGLWMPPPHGNRSREGKTGSNFRLCSDKVLSLFAPSTCTIQRHDGA